jgi:conjugal transfer pilus assembly protein TraB
MSIVQSFNNLTPSAKRGVMVVGALTLVFGVSWMLTSMTERKASKHPRADKPEVTVVAPARTTGVEQFSAKLGLLEKAQEELRIKMARYGESGSKEKPQEKVAGLEEESPLDAIPALNPQTSVFEAPTARAPALPPAPPMALPAPVAAPVPAEPGEGRATETATSPSKSIRIYSESGEMGSAQVEEKLNKPEVKSTSTAKAHEGAFIPSGSMFTGVLLNGLDAPTSAVAQKNPTPVVVRVKREALLPNYASIDVRECFLMAAGYGQLSSERAMLRAESLSCVRHDGQVIESKIDAYIVGSDGKVGIPGRLVSKQGQMIAQSLIAGALGGIGQSLTKSKVPALNINPMGGQNIYETETLGSIGQSGLAGGVGSATNMIAKFYLDMAKETFPVVEIPAGVVATVIVTRGANLPLKGSTNLQKYIDPNEKRAPAMAANRRAPAATSMEEIARTGQQGAISALKTAQDSVAAATSGNGAAKPNFENGLGW